MSDFDGLFDGWHNDPEQNKPIDREKIEDIPLREKEVHVVNIYEAISEALDGSGRTTEFFVLLKDNSGRQLRISIVKEMAHAIYIAHRRIRPDRPLTHDLFFNVVEKLGGRIERVIVDDLLQSTFYARIIIQKGDETIEMDARPSDAIALALRSRSPIYVADQVLAISENEDLSE